MSTEAHDLETLRSWSQAIRSMGASDLHIRSGLPPFVRVNGDIQPLADVQPVSESMLQGLVSEMLASSTLRGAALEDRGQVDFSFEVDGSRFRVNLFRQQGSTSISMRLLPATPPLLQDLGMPSVVEYLARSRRGMILVTGASSSGKTTTLAAILDHINRTQQRHIVTIEDPIEIVHASVRSLVTQREIGTDTVDFADGLRAALRQDPDVILIGEIRDEETMRVALSAAETGHLVLASLHTIDIADTIARVISLMSRDDRDDQQARAMLATTLVGVVSQRLVKTVDGPLVAAVETMVNTSRVTDCIRVPSQTGHLHDVIADGSYDGMQTFSQALTTLVLSGKVDVDEAFANASNRQAFRMLLQQHGFEPGRVRPMPKRVFHEDEAFEAVESTPSAVVVEAEPVAQPASPEAVPVVVEVATIQPAATMQPPPPVATAPPPQQQQPLQPAQPPLQQPPTQLPPPAHEAA